jgi:hypothetical protein
MDAGLCGARLLKARPTKNWIAHYYKKIALTNKKPPEGGLVEKLILRTLLSGHFEGMVIYQPTKSSSFRT